MESAITNINPDFLSGGGEMGELIRSKDWSKTPLGSPDTWPQSLRTAVSICIASNFPTAIVWGPQRVQIYNDVYWPITGDMHPKSMGQDFKECWSSAWPVIGQAFEEAFLGATRFLETQRIFLDRYGYVEETFFTFSFSPIVDESGGVSGLFHPGIEQTQQTLAERRLNILPAVANHTVNARTVKEASALIMDCLKDFELDIPFVLLYSIAADGKEANLEGSVGIESGSPLAPAKINLEEHTLKSWPLNEVIQNGKSVQVEKLADIFGSFNCGPYPEPPEQALVFPVILPGAAHHNYFLVAGVSARRRLDEKYLLFYELLTASVTNVLTKARAYEEERKKAEESKIEEWETGADDYLVKPFSTKELLSTVKAQIKIKQKSESALRDLYSLFEEVPFALAALKGESLTIEYINKYNLDLWQQKKEDVIGKALFEVRPDIKQSAQQIHEQIYKTGKRFNAGEIPFVLSNNGKTETRYFNAVIDPMFDERGTIVGQLATSIDITEQVVARKKIEESESKYRSIFETAEVSLWEEDFTEVKSAIDELKKQGIKDFKKYFTEHPAFVEKAMSLIKVLDVNESTIKMFEAKDKSELLGSLPKIFTPETLPVFIGELLAIAEEKTFFEAEASLRTLQGNLVHILFTMKLPQYNEEFDRILFSCFDIQKRKQYEDKLKESETRLQLITDALPVLIAYIDKNRSYRFNNKAYETWFGHSREEIYGKHMKDVLGEAAYQSLKPKIDQVLSGKPVHLEMSVPYKEGGTRWVVADYIPHFGKDNEVLGYYGVVNDVTALKKAEELNWKLAAIVQSSADAIISKTLEGIVMSWNPGAEKIFGYSAAEMIGKPINIIIPPNRRGEEPSLIKKISNDETVHHFETKRLNKDGKLIDISLTISPIKDNEGNITGASKIARDITKEKQQEQILFESEKRLRLATETTNAGTFDYNIITGELFWSAEMKVLCGYAKDETITREKAGATIHPEDAAYLMNASAASRHPSSDGELEIEHRIIRPKDQQTRWVYVRSKVSFAEVNGQKQAVRVTGILLDITERKKSEFELKESKYQLQQLASSLEDKVITRTAELKASEEKFYSLFNLSPICKTLAEIPSGKMIMANDAFTNIFGYSREEALHKTAAELGMLDAEMHETIINELKTHGKISNKEVEFVKKSGKKFFALTSAEMISIGDNQFFLGAYNDISDRKKAEQNIEQKNIELQKMNKELEAFTYISSHDLQEPLRKIQTFAGRIIATEKEQLSTTAKHYFSRIQDSAERMQTLIQDLLEFSRLSTLERKFERTDLARIVDEVKEEFKETIEEKNASIIAVEMCKANIVSFQFRQLMRNLIGNALKFSKPDVPPRILINSSIAKGNELNNKKLMLENDYCHIAVSDNGIGFEKHYSEKIFEVFQRLHGKEEYTGTGIGLAIVKKIVDNHNGIITAESELGKGATFNIYLPL